MPPSSSSPRLSPGRGRRRPCRASSSRNVAATSATAPATVGARRVRRRARRGDVRARRGRPRGAAASRPPMNTTISSGSNDPSRAVMTSALAVQSTPPRPATMRVVRREVSMAATLRSPRLRCRRPRDGAVSRPARAGRDLSLEDEARTAAPGYGRHRAGPSPRAPPRRRGRSRRRVAASWRSPCSACRSRARRVLLAGPAPRARPARAAVAVGAIGG